MRATAQQRIRRRLLFAALIAAAFLLNRSAQQREAAAPGGEVASRLSALGVVGRGQRRERGALQLPSGGQEAALMGREAEIAAAPGSSAGGGLVRGADGEAPLVIVYRGVFQGLCNQLYALLSMLTVAGELRAGLVLPPSRRRATFEQRRGWIDAPVERLLNLPRMQAHWGGERGVQLYQASRPHWGPFVGWA